jgi:mono/diheme cytochrome c family protein
VPYLIPNLANSPSVAARATAPAIPAFGWQLSDAEVATVTTYIGNSWSHAAPAVTEHDVHEAREKLSKR